MRIARAVPELLALSVGLILFAPVPAEAYLDPGTGSLFIQGVLATLAAAGYALRVYWKRIKAAIGRHPSDEPDSESRT